MKKLSALYEKNAGKLRLALTAVSGVCLLASLLCQWTGNENAIAAFDPSWAAIVLCGLPIVAGAIVGVIKDHDITADVLVSLALVGSLILKEWFAAGEVAFIMQIGSILEDLTSDRARKGISKLIKLTPRKANLLVNGKTEVIDADNVRVNDLLLVLAGESIPVDGVIVKGNTGIDQSAMTGESMPAEKGAGDTVMSGTINQSGAITVRATKTAENSSMQRMVRLAESADAQKAKIVRKANRWAAWLVVISLSTAIAAGVVIGLLHADPTLGFTRAVTVLVVLCPCAFVLATPTAISAGIGNASRHGVIIQSGEALERIAAATVAVFDKTGTLTKGKPSVVKVDAIGQVTEEELIRIAASGEALSDHPLAKAISAYNDRALYEVSEHQTVAGRGVRFKIGETAYFVGKTEEGGENAASVVGVYRDGVLLGTICMADTIKDNAKETVAQLKALGISSVLLTGDNEAAAKAAADKLGVAAYAANCSPEDKMAYIRKREAEGDRVAMFGDGVNDALALRTAYAGVAMGGIGSDAAIESAEAVIVHDNLDVVPYLFRISRKIKKRIHINLIISMVLNFIAVALSIAGILNTVWGALFHNCGSVAVVISAFLLLFAERQTAGRAK